MILSLLLLGCLVAFLLLIHQLFIAIFGRDDRESALRSPVVARSSGVEDFTHTTAMLASSREALLSAPPAREEQPLVEKKPRRKLGFTTHGFKLAEALGRGFSKDIFGDSPENPKEIPFSALSPIDQLAEMDRVRSLVAELRDLRRGTAEESDVESVPESEQSVFEVNGIILAGALGETKQLADADEERVLMKSKEREEKLVEMLHVTGSRPGIRDAYARSIPELYLQMKSMERIAQLKRQAVALERAISAHIMSSQESASNYAVGKKAIRIDDLRAQLQDIRTQLVRHEGTSEPRMERVAEIRSYAKQYATGMMIEVPTVRALKDQLMENIRARRHFLIAGHLGGGKTELARQALRQFMVELGIGYDVRALKSAVETGNEAEKSRIVQDIQPLIYSANEDSSVYDLIGIWKLEARTSPTPEQAAQEALEMVAAFQRQGIDIPTEEAIKIRMGQANLVETVFRHTALGRAVAEGRPIIIDEMNMMRNETRGALNNILTARVGQEVSLPGNGGQRYLIQPGFVVVGTLNLGAQYGGTKEINAAQLSRWVGQEMDYPEVSETFDLILAALLRDDRATLPPDFPPNEYERLATLAIVTREVQDMFSGKAPGLMFMARETGIEPKATLLKKAVISPRDLLRNIIEPWRDSGFAVALENVIASNILARARLAEGNEQKVLTELFIRRGFFKDWDEKRFRAAGVSSVSQREIEVLQAAMNDFQKTDAWADSMKSIAQRAGDVRAAMLIGNRALNAAE